jgi:hypothetical protein
LCITANLDASTSECRMILCARSFRLSIDSAL